VARDLIRRASEESVRGVLGRRRSGVRVERWQWGVGAPSGF
jgi:hypothetical protein